MVVDSSALMAILGREPEEREFRNAIKTAANRLLSAATRVEVGLVALSRRGEPGLDQMRALLEGLKLEVVALSDEQAKLAIDAFRRFGKGRHPAGLNFGDCFSYALAKATGEPLLFKGDDFSQTDIERAG
ncbi:MAG: type II toxin-antitoxin system VapC family toxin [Caulobacteraceae bacterium]|nr:type II toxin-antitoxin system VapC family toxin [Caulobacteraceae bacterium]